MPQKKHLLDRNRKGNRTHCFHKLNSNRITLSLITPTRWDRMKKSNQFNNAAKIYLVAAVTKSQLHCSKTDPIPLHQDSENADPNGKDSVKGGQTIIIHRKLSYLSPLHQVRNWELQPISKRVT